MINIYLESGYLNAPAILDLGLTFNFIVGGRAVGKTYGFLSAVVDRKSPFILMRRTQAQADIISKEDFSPFKAICIDRGFDISTESAGKYAARFVMNEEPIGYICALSTIANMRGFDASDIQVLLYDEFIPEKHERPIKNEGAAFLNAYETINRNRELKGAKPVQVVCMANAFNIANPIFMELGLVGIAEKMKSKNQEIYIDRNRSIALIMPTSERIKSQKSRTALYKLTEHSDFNRMALNNDFVYNPTDNVKPQPLNEYKPLVTVGEITVYTHKSKKGYYVTEHRSGNPPTFKTDEVDLKRYINGYGYMLNRAYINNLIKFENLLTKSLFELYTI